MAAFDIELVDWEAYRMEKERKGFYSQIEVDHDHAIRIQVFSLSRSRKWYVWYSCDCHISGRFTSSFHDSFLKAKKRAFELANTKCTFCYDEHGVRRRN